MAAPAPIAIKAGRLRDGWEEALDELDEHAEGLYWAEGHVCDGEMLVAAVVETIMYRPGEGVGVGKVSTRRAVGDVDDVNPETLKGEVRKTAIVCHEHVSNRQTEQQRIED
jgi:hypothetical protein